MRFIHFVIGAFVFVSTAGNAVIATSAAASEAPVTYKVDKAHTRILWEAVSGSGIFLGFFNGATGEINFVESSPEKSSVHIIISMDKLMTGVDHLDGKLKSDEFFDAANFPEAVFNSTAIEITGEKTAIITGDLTVHGVTKEVALEAMFRNHVDLGRAERIAFAATTVFRRSDFGVTHMDDWIEDDVKIRIELEGARRKKPPVDNP